MKLFLFRILQEPEEDTMVVLVIPFGMTNNFTSSCKLSSVSRVKEKDVICAAFSGHLDPSLMVSAPGKNSELFLFYSFMGKVVLWLCDNFPSIFG